VLRQRAAARPTIDEVLARAGGRTGGSVPVETAVEIVRADRGVLAVALADDGPDGDKARARLRGENLAAPELIDLEVASVLCGRSRAGALDDRRATLALADPHDLPLRRASHQPLLSRCWELRDNLTTYDAAHVALAEALHVTLLTGDRRLARAPGLRCPLELFDPAG
jgi:predicted nucleic acid-binding protein